MRAYYPKSTPRVKRGRVQKKNNWIESGSYYNTPQQLPVVDRKRPGLGYRHLLKQKNIYAFIGILPDWQEISKGLNAIVLAPGDWDLDGWHEAGVVHICAWEADLWIEHTREHCERHRDVFDRLGLVREQRKGYVLCKWTEPQARAYQLLHVFLHELGHHHDHRTTRPGGLANRGEPYAEAYARKYEDMIWDRYLEVFGLD